MEDTRREFLDLVRTAWQPTDGVDLDRTAGSVLRHLRDRLPLQEAEHLLGHLPARVREMAAWPGVPPEERGDHPAPQVEGREEFVRSVKEDAHLPDHGEAERAVYAVMGAIKYMVGDTEAHHIQTQLPAGLRDLWDRS